MSPMYGRADRYNARFATFLGLFMNADVNYQNNPLHGVGLKTLVTEIVEHYGFEILFAYLNINCFNSNPSIDSSVKFLKKTDWAREKVEAFYLYKFKSLPRASAEQFELPPRDRIIPLDQMPGEPAELSFEDAERLREKRARKAAMHDAEARPRAKAERSRGSYSGAAASSDSDPWAKWRK
ncbi:VF530 family DNA-binding protein [Azonexus sp.]|uniref:VF530 family protein n=1 Tax=Azonexus sp. TaxID=1872668 RepID=UPI0027B8A3FB|nr:VF530 family DNA-binding protein [Azonexus sp.]